MQNNENFTGNTNLFPTTIHEGVQVVDSRLIAEALGIEHRALVQLMREHQAKIERNFGILTFQMEVSGKVGQPKKYVLLTEDQTIFIGTLSRNTEQVVDFKALVVASFSQARKQIQEAKFLLESVQGDISPLKEIAELRQEVSSLRQDIKSLQEYGEYMKNLVNGNFLKAETYVLGLEERHEERIEALESKHQDSKGTLDTTVTRVDKIEERLDFKAVACVYVMYCKRRQWHKLGSSYDAKDRKDDFATVERNLKIIIEIPTSSREEAYALENALKKRFAPRHKEGEWYALLPEDLAYLHELAQSNRLHLLRTTTT